MSVESTLVRAEADLREGREPLARRRLHGLLSNDPTDLAARRRLADAYRRTGQLDECGRWSYLDEELSGLELAAFERRFRDPARRLAVLRWPDPARRPPSTPTARRRLAALYRAATGTAPDWPEHREDAAAPAPATVGPPAPAPVAPVGRRPARRHCTEADLHPQRPAHVAAFHLTLVLVAVAAVLLALVL
ncbi:MULTISPECIES: DUF6584 family protein [unclassified Kitasatospora]|uniref:DUF6584 family protein n=1 Tax=unclassified Kitasatospora TaxID=2633591 RepID=UPI00380C0370